MQWVYARLGLRHDGPLGGEQLDDARLSGTRLAEQLDVQTGTVLFDGALLDGALLLMATNILMAHSLMVTALLMATNLLMAHSLQPSSMATIFLMARSLALVNGASL
jgi:hypothetical protein